MSIAQPEVDRRRLVRAGSRGLGYVVMPVALVAIVLALAVGSRLASANGNLTGLIQFGRNFTSATHPPSGASVISADGYDGQFFYLQALDPLLLRDATVTSFHHAGAGFRMQRVAYPALAFLIAAGHPGAVPLALLAINLFVLLALATGFALYARRRGWSPWCAVAIVLMPGMLLPALRDLSDPVAVASMLTGLLLWRSGRRWPAGLALAVAVLTREVMMLAVVAVVAEAGARAWRARPTPGAARKQLLSGWPVVALPTVAFALWQAYVTGRYGGPVGGAGLQLPFVNLVKEISGAFHGYLPMALWDLAYLLLIVAATGAAVISLRQRVTITSAGACALALGVLVPKLGDAWSDTRLSAPMLALLLVDGLQRHSRSSVLIVVAAASMTILAPLAIPGTF